MDTLPMIPTGNADAPSFVLAPDARILTLEELPDSFRRTLNAEPGDVVVDRPRQRRQSQLIGADTASLLEAFREPATIADALLRLSREQDAEPFELLETAFPAIKTLIEKELLIPSGPDMEHTPRRLFAMIEAGLKEEVLRSNTPWYCVSCYYCMAR